MIKANNTNILFFKKRNNGLHFYLPVELEIIFAEVNDHPFVQL